MDTARLLRICYAYVWTWSLECRLTRPVWRGHVYLTRLASCMQAWSLYEKACLCASKVPQQYFEFYFSDIFKTGQWKSSQTTADRDLLPLADQLPDVCMSAKAPTILKKYEYTIIYFRKWCISHNVSFCSDFRVALYLKHHLHLGKATGSLDEAFYAVGLIHWRDCWTPVTQTLQNCQRRMQQKYWS